MTRLLRGLRRGVTALGVVIICATAAAAVQRPTAVPPSLTARDLACLPRIAVALDAEPPRIVGSQREASQLYGAGDTLIVDGAQGLAVGEEYFVRRFAPASTSGRSASLQILHTAAWVRVTAVDGQTAIASVISGCDAILRGDFLQTAEWPEPPTPAPPGQADYADTGTILFGKEGRIAAGSGDFVVIDRGATNGVEAGQRLTVYRDSPDRAGPVTELGEAFVVEVTPAWSIAQVLKARDFIYAGDGVALHK